MRIKICGVTNVGDALAAVQLGADALGLNFYSQSPRYIQRETARETIAQLPPFVEPVAVLVEPSSSEVKVCHLELGFRTIQCHAPDTAPIANALADIPHSSIKVIVARGIADREDVQAAQACIRRCKSLGLSPAAILLDARVAGQHGGTGRSLPWRLIDDIDFGTPVILAGGLNPENVAEAIRVVRPFGVDVASGVESAPGRKDPLKMKAFIDRAREAAASLHC